MKTLYFFLTMLACYNISMSQETNYNIKDSAKIIDVRYIKDDLVCTERNTNIVNLPFSRISFIDVRYDTSFIAISYELGAGNYNLNTKCDLKSGLEASFSSCFMDFFKGSFSNNDAELICYVKRFSITPEGSMVAMTQDGGSQESPNNIAFETECYCRFKDSLYPAVRIDTTYMQRSGRLKKTYLAVTEKVLYPLTEKLKNIDSLKVKKRNSYTLQQIQDRYQTRFNLPILTTNQYKRGIYKSFQEFINNSPSITEFRTETKGFTTSLYDVRGSKINTAIFGFCDGETCWMYWAGYCTPLTRVGNSFEYFRTLFISGAYGINTKKKFLAVLDMESGRAE
jgi:hypothetical protein